MKKYGKSILVRPPHELRKQLEEEAESQNRSLSNLVLIILMKFFRQHAATEAEHAE